MSSTEVLKKIKEVLHPAINIYDNLNLGRQWNTPGCSTNANIGPPTCDNCGGPHIAPECTLPRDEEKIKKAQDARLKAQAGRGGGRGRGGCCGRGGGCGDKRSQWSNSNDAAKTATTTQGVECINNVWRMKCNKGCGWNTTHTSKYCDKFKRNGASFSVPASHLYWTLSKKAHPGAAATGSFIPPTGSSDGSQSTMSNCMIFMINNRITQTENSEVASFLAEMKNSLLRN